MKFSEALPETVLDETTLALWSQQAARGEALVYFRGFLVRDREATTSRLPTVMRDKLKRVADLAFHLWSEGKAHLLQRKLGDYDFEYLVIAR